VVEVSPIVVKPLTRGQTLQHVMEDAKVSVELVIARSPILLMGVADRFIIGTVGPEDGPVGCEPMAPDHSMVEVMDHLPYRTKTRACSLQGAASCLAPVTDSEGCLCRRVIDQPR